MVKITQKRNINDVIYISIMINDKNYIRNYKHVFLKLL